MNTKNNNIHPSTKEIEYYKDLKSRESALNKELKPLYAKIKDYMIATNVQQLTGGDSTIYLQERQKEVVIESELIKCIKASGIKGLIKRKEYVDMDALDTLLYSKGITKEELKGCYTHNTTYVMTFK